MIFSELYSVYYNAVAAILRESVKAPVSDFKMREIISREAFGESTAVIADALKKQKWQLLQKDGTTPIKNAPTMPTTTLQKRWLKSITLDPRIRLFFDEIPEFPDVEPLFTEEDYTVFDKYSDGDSFYDEEYILHFRTVLDAVKNSYPLKIETVNRFGEKHGINVMPKHLEYSEKDDKFRLICRNSRYETTLNLARILSVERYDGEGDFNAKKANEIQSTSVIFEVTDERNALERVLLHFAHFEKQAEKIEGGRYRVTLKYDKSDEIEILIRILSFGPFVKVVSPAEFKNLIKNRLEMQKSCDLP